jgi:hypothetical protein
VISLISGLPSSLSAGGFPLCSDDSSVLFRCPTPRSRARGPHGFCLSPAGLSGSFASGISEVSRPGSRAWNVQTCMVSTTTQGRPATRFVAAVRVAFRPDHGVATLIADFRSSIPSPSIPCYASLGVLRQSAQNSGPSGSLLLSRKVLSSSIPCRFIAAHNLALLIHAEHDGSIRRVHIQPNDVAHFRSEFRIGAEFERLYPMRL